MASLPNTRRASALPLALLHQAQRKLSRSEQEDLIELLLEHIDRQDGDPDEEDATDLEDDWTFAAGTVRHYLDRGPGCPVSDPGGQCDEDCQNTGSMHGMGTSVAGCYISDGGI